MKKNMCNSKNFIEVSFLLLHFFCYFFLSVFVAMFNNVFCSPAKSKALLNIWFKILTSLET